MTAAAIIVLALKASVFALVFALGLRARAVDATYFLRHRRRFLRAVLAMAVVVPVAATIVVRRFDLALPVALAILAMSISPVPPILPKKQLKAGGHADYTIGMLVTAALLSIVTVPIVVALLGRLFHQNATIAPWQVARVVGSSVVIPIVLGMLVHRLSPRLAERAAPVITTVGTLLLMTGLVPVLVKMWPAIASLLGDGSALAMALVVAIAIVAGHVIGGPDPADRSTLAIASAMRHPGVALAIATANAPDERLIPAAVILFVLVGVVLTTLYVAVVRRIGGTRSAAATA